MQTHCSTCLVGSMTNATTSAGAGDGAASDVLGRSLGADLYGAPLSFLGGMTVRAPAMQPRTHTREQLGRELWLSRAIQRLRWALVVPMSGGGAMGAEGLTSWPQRAPAQGSDSE